MTPLEYANSLTNPKGVTPFCPIAIRWSKERREWCAMNRIDRGWSSTAYMRGRIDQVLGRLNVRVVAFKCDDHSVYMLCDPKG